MRERDWARIYKQLITKQLSDMKNSHMDLHSYNILLVFGQGRVDVIVIDSGGV